MYYTERISFNYLNNPLRFNSTSLIQLGSLLCKPLGKIKKHAHINWYELTIVTSGEGIILTNDIPKKVGKGDIYLSCPGDFHEIISSGEKPLRYDFFSFNTANPIIKKSLFKISTNIYDYGKRIIHNKRIEDNIKKTLAEYSSDNKFKDEILCLLFEETLYEIIRSFDSILIPPKKGDDSSRELCAKIMHYIDTNIYSIKSLQDLADVFSYNYSYLSHLFKTTMEITLLDYYHNRRLDAARLLIEEGEFTITAVSEKLNYSSLYAFSKAFKNKYGCAPKKYSNQI